MMEQAFMSALPPPPAPELTLLVMSLLLNRRILEAVIVDTSARRLLEGFWGVDDDTAACAFWLL
jgi:hypothetical protein